MRRVDRVYKQVLRAYGQNDKQVSLGMVTPLDNGQWKAVADLWDGIEGSLKPEDRVISYHSTEEEAIKAIEALADAHRPLGKMKPLKEKFPIIIDDITA